MPAQQPLLRLARGPATGPGPTPAPPLNRSSAPCCCSPTCPVPSWTTPEPCFAQGRRHRRPRPAAPAGRAPRPAPPIRSLLAQLQQTPPPAGRHHAAPGPGLLNPFTRWQISQRPGAGTATSTAPPHTDSLTLSLPGLPGTSIALPLERSSQPQPGLHALTQLGVQHLQPLGEGGGDDASASASAPRPCCSVPSWPTAAPAPTAKPTTSTPNWPCTGCKPAGPRAMGAGQPIQPPALRRPSLAERMATQRPAPAPIGARAAPAPGRNGRSGNGTAALSWMATTKAPSLAWTAPPPHPPPPTAHRHQRPRAPGACNCAWGHDQPQHARRPGGRATRTELRAHASTGWGPWQLQRHRALPNPARPARLQPPARYRPPAPHPAPRAGAASQPPCPGGGPPAPPPALPSPTTDTRPGQLHWFIGLQYSQQRSNIAVFAVRQHGIHTGLRWLH